MNISFQEWTLRHAMTNLPMMAISNIDAPCLKDSRAVTNIDALSLSARYKFKNMGATRSMKNSVAAPRMALQPSSSSTFLRVQARGQIKEVVWMMQRHVKTVPHP